MGSDFYAPPCFTLNVPMPCLMPVQRCAALPASGSTRSWCLDDVANHRTQSPVSCRVLQGIQKGSPNTQAAMMGALLSQGRSGAGPCLRATTWPRRRARRASRSPPGAGLRAPRSAVGRARAARAEAWRRGARSAGRALARGEPLHPCTICCCHAGLALYLSMPASAHAKEYSRFWHIVQSQCSRSNTHCRAWDTDWLHAVPCAFTIRSLTLAETTMLALCASWFHATFNAFTSCSAGAEVAFALAQIMNPPLVGVLAGIAVGACPLGALLYQPSSPAAFARRSTAAAGAARLLGCAIPYTQM